MCLQQEHRGPFPHQRFLQATQTCLGRLEPALEGRREGREGGGYCNVSLASCVFALIALCLLTCLVHPTASSPHPHILPCVPRSSCQIVIIRPLVCVCVSLVTIPCISLMTVTAPSVDFARSRLEWWISKEPPSV